MRMVRPVAACVSLTLVSSCGFALPPLQVGTNVSVERNDGSFYVREGRTTIGYHPLPGAGEPGWFVYHRHKGDHDPLTEEQVNTPELEYNRVLVCGFSTRIELAQPGVPMNSIIVVPEVRTPYSIERTGSKYIVDGIHNREDEQCKQALDDFRRMQRDGRLKPWTGS